MKNQVDILENRGLINYNNNYNKDNECLDFFQLNKSENINKISYIKQPAISKSFSNSFEENSLESKINKYSINLNTITFEDIIFKDDFKISKEENIQMKKKRKFSTKKMKLGRNKKIHKKKESIINLGKII